MLKFWCQQDSDTNTVLERFNGVPQEIADYLSAQVFAGLDEQTRCALVESATLMKLIEKDVEGIFPGRGYWQILCKVSSLSPFVEFQGVEQTTLHLNPIFQDYLRQEFKHKDTAKWLEANQRAAEWFADRNQILTALRHARFCSDTHLAAQIVLAAGGPAPLDSPGQDALKRYLSAFKYADH